MWPVFAWIHPELVVRLLHSDGRESYWLTNGRTIRKSNQTFSSNNLVAVELPEPQVLRRSIQVPVIASTDLQAALSLEARCISPFPAEDLVLGYWVGDGGRAQAGAELFLASRRQVNAYVAEVSGRKGLKSQPQVWTFSTAGLPIAFADIGLNESSRLLSRKRWGLVGFVLLAMCILSGIVITPTAQLRLRAIEAVNGFTSLVQASDPAIRKRAEVQALSEQVNALVSLTAENVDVLTLIERLTTWLPDDTSLISLTVKGNKVGLYGITTNAATLMQHLSSLEGVKEVKAPQAAMRPSGASKDVFSIDFQYLPKQADAKGEAVDAAADVSARAVSAPNVQVDAKAGSASAVVPVYPAPTPQVGGGARTGGASFGGASFGGTSARPEVPGRSGAKP